MGSRYGRQNGPESSEVGSAHRWVPEGPPLQTARNSSLTAPCGSWLNSPLTSSFLGERQAQALNTLWIPRGSGVTSFILHEVPDPSIHPAVGHSTRQL